MNIRTITAAALLSFSQAAICQTPSPSPQATLEQRTEEAIAKLQAQQAANQSRTIAPSATQERAGQVFGEGEVSIEVARNIKTYTPVKLEQENVKPGDGVVIKLSFCNRGAIRSEIGDYLETTLSDGFTHSVNVLVSESVRKWFLKIPEGYCRTPQKNYVVFLRADGGKWKMVGNSMEIGFRSAKIKWSGQDSQ